MVSLVHILSPSVIKCAVADHRPRQSIEDTLPPAHTAKKTTLFALAAGNFKPRLDSL